MSRPRNDFRTPRSTNLIGLELQNFKSIKSANIPIRPLTIVAGSNSAGKSSLLQAVLALTQVSKRRIEGGRFPLNDDLTQLGTLDSVRNQRAEPTDLVTLTYEFASSLRDMRRALGRPIGFTRDEFEQAGFKVEDGEDIEYAEMKWSIGLGSQFGKQKSSARIANVNISVDTGTLFLDAEIDRSDYYDLEFEEEDDESHSPYRGLISFGDKYTFDDPYGASGTLDIADAKLSSGQISSFFGPPKEAARREIVDHFEKRILRQSLHRLDDDRTLHLEAAQRASSQYLANRVRYIGPLRHAPHLPFGSAPDPDSGTVGVSGEHVAAVLQAKRTERNRYPLPHDHNTELSLEEAVNQWLRFFELADSLNVREGTPLVYSIDLVPPGLEETVPFHAVGVGVSQLLPVIVQCLVAGPGALVVLEQPELHLHPAAQQRLGDFLIACTHWGQRILVETHSEYLVLRLRRRIAEDYSDELRQQVAILFAERDAQGDTNFRKVELNEVGGVLDWPDGFFDQGQDEAHELLIAAAERQRRAEEKH